MRLNACLLCTTGIATALKVLFSSEDCTGSSTSLPQLRLERNEVIALLNLLERFAASLTYYHQLSAAQLVLEPGSGDGLLTGGSTVQ
jgi:ERO1-like protein alpha